MTVGSSGLCQDFVEPVEEEVEVLICWNLVGDVPPPLLVGCFFAWLFTNAVTCFNLNSTVYLELILSVKHSAVTP